MYLIILFISLFLLCGCSSVTARDSSQGYPSNKEIFMKTKHESIQKNIGNKIKVGMNKIQVQKLWGEANLVESKNRIDFDGLEVGADELWTYPIDNEIQDQKIRYFKLYFKTGILIKILEINNPVK